MSLCCMLCKCMPTRSTSAMLIIHYMKYTINNNKTDDFSHNQSFGIAS